MWLYCFVKFLIVTTALVDTTPVIKVTGDPDHHDDDVFLHNFERNSSYKPTNDTGRKRYQSVIVVSVRQ